MVRRYSAICSAKKGKTAAHKDKGTSIAEGSVTRAQLQPVATFRINPAALALQIEQAITERQALLTSASEA
jgi:hypothetical protein